MIALDKRLWALCALLAVGCNGAVANMPEVDDGADAAVGGEDAGVREDAGRDDAGRDAGRGDAGRGDAGEPTRDASADAATERDAGAQDAGDAGDAPATGRSEGCGMAATSDGDFAEQTVRINNTERTYNVRLPGSYDASRAYALIFRFHGYGGDGLSGGLGIEGPAGNDAIIVAPDGLNQGWSNGSEAGDLALFDAMYEAVTTRYCVDRARVFSYGFSMGGGFTNLLGCRRADKLRGTAAVAGFDRGTGTCARPVAAWFQHDRNDDAVPIAQGTGARDRVIQRAHCSTSTTPAGSCVSYQGCDPGYPVVWCETTGRGHNIAGDTAPQAVWDFFRALP
ncbi:MAG: hypothetical protein ABW352_14435 [Polyangiales bacterium]